jgi:hypothetical protein
MAARIIARMALDKGKEYEQNMNITGFGNKRLGGQLPS